MTDFTSAEDVGSAAAAGRLALTAVAGATPAALRVNGARIGMDYAPASRTGAFGVSARHTARVKFLKRAFVIVPLLAVVGISVVVAFNPFRHIGAVSLASVGVSGTKVTMDQPKITGVQQGGGAYEVRAKSGIQDITTPSVMDLLGVDAEVGMADSTTTHVTSRNGTYNSRADTMDLIGDVEIANTSGYTLHLRRAFLDFKNNTLSSHEHTKVDIEGGTVSADNLMIANNGAGHIIRFDGGVTSTFDSSDSPAPDGTQAAR